MTSFQPTKQKSGPMNNLFQEVIVEDENEATEKQYQSNTSSGVYNSRMSANNKQNGQKRTHTTVYGGGQTRKSQADQFAG